MINKVMLCVVLLIAAIGLSGCVQNPLSNNSPEQISKSISFDTATGLKLDQYRIQPSDAEYKLLIGASDGWYIVYYDSVKKVSGYVDGSLTPGIDTGWIEIPVYYVWVHPDNQTEIVRLKVKFDTVQGGIIETITPINHGYPFVIEENPNKIGGYY